MPEIPKGAKKPSDHLKAEVEALDQTAPVTFEFKGAQFRVLPFFDWDKSAVQAINTLNVDGWARGALHEDDVAQFVNTRATVRESVQFVKHVGEIMGADLDPGELFAS